MSENFETFLRFWIAENIHPLDRTDPRDRDQIVHSRARELASAATTAGFYGELVEAAHPYGGVEAFVRDKLRQAGGRSKPEIQCAPSDETYAPSAPGV
jgi:hypothetical protein